jgi:REP element-mobilizing transposase RayT
VTLYQNKFRIESTRLRHWDYRLRAWYFVTICTHEKAHIFSEIIDSEVQLSRIGRIADSDLRRLGNHYENVQLDSHVVMPNHLHAIVMIDGDHCHSPNPNKLPSQNGISPAAGSLSTIIRSYKAGVSRQCHELGLKQSVWQPRFYDRILRGHAVISAVREYIWNNPANWAGDDNNSSSLPNFVET